MSLLLTGSAWPEEFPVSFVADALVEDLFRACSRSCLLPPPAATGRLKSRLQRREVRLRGLSSRRRRGLALLEPPFSHAGYRWVGSAAGALSSLRAWKTCSGPVRGLFPYCRRLGEPRVARDPAQAGSRARQAGRPGGCGDAWSPALGWRKARW